MKVTLQNGWKIYEPNARNVNLITLFLHSEQVLGKSKYEIHIWLLNFGLHVTF